MSQKMSVGARSVWVVVMLAWLCVPAGAELTSLMFTQANFLQGADSVLNSEWGGARLQFTGTAGWQYFNLVVNGNWVIQNAPLCSTEGPNMSHDLLLNFNLCSPRGTNVTSLNYLANLGTSMYSSQPTGTPQAAPVYDYSVTVGGRNGGLGVIPGAVGIHLWALPVAWGSNPGGNMVNQDCGVDECEVAAYSNSLQWLDARDPNISIPDEKKSTDAMKYATGWQAPTTDPNGNAIPGTGGCSGESWEGKRDLVAGEGITTQTFDMSDIDDVIDQLNDGQDVELWGEHHVAVVNSIAKFAGGAYAIQVSHDTQQGTDGGTTSQVFGYNAGTGQITGGAFGFGAGESLDRFIVECPLPSKPGDANVDGAVNAGDLALMGGSWMMMGMSWYDGDFNGDGIVDAGDLALMGGNWMWTRQPAPEGGSVPEPATLALMALGVTSLIRRKRK